MDQPTIPNRNTLVEQLENANRHAWLWVTIRMAAIGTLAWFIQWDKVVLEPIVSVTACLVIAGPFLTSLFQLWGQNKKLLEDVKESTRFGDLDKHKIRNLVQETIQRLKLPDDRLPIYITSDKSLNAGAFRGGTLFGWVNGIYLNRQVLHKLAPQEIQSIIGHELGHYYRFNLIGDRFRVLTLVVGALVGLLVVQQVEQTGFLGFIILSLTSGVFWYLSGLAMLRHGFAIEHLCDDFGAQVHGVLPSISGLMKVGLDAETRYALQLELLARSANHALLSPADVAEAIEKATPLGHVAEPDLYESVTRELKAKAESNRKLSVGGFLRYIQDGERDDEDYLADLQEQAQRINQVERIDWESILDDPGVITFNETQAKRLIDLIENSPGQSLFRLPDATGATDGIHPPLNHRLLYLWRNRSEPLDSARTRSPISR